jgi:hypothetical protein
MNTETEQPATPMPPEVLMLRGNTAVAMLQTLSAHFKARAKEIDDLLGTVDALDKSYGIEALNANGEIAALLKVAREAMPHLAHLSDEVLLKTFGKKTK